MSGCTGPATPFDSGIIYIIEQIEFLLLFSDWKLDTFMNMENEANAHVCDRLRSAASFGYMANFYLLMPRDLWGRELFALIVFGQSRPSVGRCIQLHAFFVS